MRYTETINSTINTAVNQMLDLLKSSLDQCQVQLLKITDRSQCDIFNEVIDGKKRLISEWEDQMEIHNIKIDKRTDTAVKDAYPDRTDDVNRIVSLQNFERKLIAMRGELLDRDDLPVSFKQTLSTYHGYIF